MKIRIAVMLTCVLAMIAGPYAAAQGYPAKPVRMLVAFQVLAHHISRSVRAKT